MNVKELIEKLSELNQELPVYVMGDNGCHDPGYDEASRVSCHISKWHGKEIVFIDSDF